MDEKPGNVEETPLQELFRQEVNKAIADISQRTGLSPETVSDLLHQNWVFHQKLNEPDRWVHEAPLLILQRRTEKPESEQPGSSTDA